MKEGWEIKPFSEICYSIEDGDWIEKKDQSDSGIRLVQTGNVGVGQYRDKSDKSKFISEETFKRLKCTEIVAGDVLISRLPDPVGRACILPPLKTKCITAVDCSILKLKPNEIVPSWFIYYTQSEAYFSSVRAECSGTTRDRITRKKLSIITIPIPSLYEQQRIVDILDKEFEKIDRLKSNAELNLQNAKSLLGSIQTKLLLNKSWRKYSLADVCSQITDGTHRTPKYLPQGIPFLSVKNITGGFLDLENTRFISQEEHQELIKRCNPEYGDILYTKVGTTGVARLINTHDEFSIFVSLALLKVNQGIIKNSLLVYILNSPYVWEQAQKLTRGVANRNFVISDIKKVEVYIPPISEQDKIESEIERYLKQISIFQDNYNKTLSLCDDLKQSLLRKAFNGEL